MRTARVRQTQTAETRDSGQSLTEVLVAITLMGIAMLPIMLAGIATIKASASSRTAARVETVLSNAADRVNRASAGCNYDVYVQAAAQAVGWTAAQASATYSYYVPAASPVSLGTWVASACPTGGVRPAGLVQKVTITVTGPLGQPQRTIVMVKSDV